MADCVLLHHRDDCSCGHCSMCAKDSLDMHKCNEKALKLDEEDNEDSVYYEKKISESKDSTSTEEGADSMSANNKIKRPSTSSGATPTKGTPLCRYSCLDLFPCFTLLPRLYF